MKIVNRKAFLQLPSGTIYSLYTPQIFEGLYVKTSSPDDNWGNDWVKVSLIDGFIKDDKDPLEHDHFAFDLDGTVRDGLYEEKQLFAVYEKEDILKLIGRLSYSFLEVDME